MQQGRVETELVLDESVTASAVENAHNQVIEEIEAASGTGGLDFATGGTAYILTAAELRGSEEVTEQSNTSLATTLSPANTGVTSNTNNGNEGNETDRTETKQANTGAGAKSGAASNNDDDDDEEETDRTEAEQASILAAIVLLTMLVIVVAVVGGVRYYNRYKRTVAPEPSKSRDATLTTRKMLVADSTQSEPSASRMTQRGSPVTTPAPPQRGSVIPQHFATSSQLPGAQPSNDPFNTDMD